MNYSGQKRDDRNAESRTAAGPPVVLVTSNHWNGLEYQRHHLARRFAARGQQVYFIERTAQRWPRPGLKDLKSWLFCSGYGSESMNKAVPENVVIMKPRWLPPSRFLRPINRQLVRGTVADLPKQPRPILISYLPTYNVLDLIAELNPCLTAYVCVHEYDHSSVMPDLLEADRELIDRCDLLYADSLHLKARLERLCGGQQVWRSPPGVEYTTFAAARRGDEAQRCRTLYYFGGVGPHMDLPLYGRIAQSGVKVVFVGVVDPAVSSRIPPEIEIRPPVACAELPVALKDADMLMIAYEQSPFIRGVIPAKFFECLGTGKPVLVSGLAEAEPYLDCVYDLRASPEKALDVIANLSRLHTPERQQRQAEVAREADWSNRFEQFYEPIEQLLNARAY
jgi:hypothetical protein